MKQDLSPIPLSSDCLTPSFTVEAEHNAHKQAIIINIEVPKVKFT